MTAAAANVNDAMPLWSWCFMELEEGGVQICLDKDAPLRDERGTALGKVMSADRGRTSEELYFRFANRKKGKYFSRIHYRPQVHDEKQKGLQACRSNLDFLGQLELSFQVIRVPRNQKRAAASELTSNSKTKRMAIELSNDEDEDEDNHIMKRMKVILKDKYIATMPLDVSNINLPPPTHQCRELHQDWILAIQQGILCGSSFGPQTVIPVMVDDLEQDEVFETSKRNEYQYSSLGGNHLIRAIKDLQDSDEVDDFQYRFIQCEVFYKLQWDQALMLGNAHNTAGDQLKLSFNEMCLQAHSIYLNLQAKDEFRQCAAAILPCKTPDHLSLVLFVGRQEGAVWSLIRKVFETFPGNPGKGTPQKIFKVMQGLKGQGLKSQILKLAIKDGLKNAIAHFEEKKKIALLKGHLCNILEVDSWETATHTFNVDEEDLNFYSALPVTMKECPQLFARFCKSLQSATTEEENREDNQISVQITLKNKGEELTTVTAQRLIKKYEAKLSREVLAKRTSLLQEHQQSQNFPIPDGEDALSASDESQNFPIPDGEDALSASDENPALPERVPDKVTSTLKTQGSPALPEGAHEEVTSTLKTQYLSEASQGSPALPEGAHEEVVPNSQSSQEGSEVFEIQGVLPRHLLEFHLPCEPAVQQRAPSPKKIQERKPKKTSQIINYLKTYKKNLVKN